MPHAYPSQPSAAEGEAQVKIEFNEDAMRQLVIDTTKKLNPDLTPEQLEETIKEALIHNGYKP